MNWKNVVAVFVAALFFALLFIHVAHATAAKEWKYNTPETHAWFENLRNPDWPYSPDADQGLKGISCCKEADADVLRDHGDWRIDEDGKSYDVLLRGNWEKIPPYAVLNNPEGGNPTGGAVVFYNHYLNFPPTVYCFVRPPEG